MANAEYGKYLIGGTLKERRARKIEKEHTILNFLVKETYSDTKTLAKLLGLSHGTTTATLRNLVEREWIVGMTIEGSREKYWGITRQGILLAGEVLRGIGESGDIKQFVPHMVKPSTLPHKLKVQEAIIHREAILKRFWQSEAVDAGQLNFENPYQYLHDRSVTPLSNVAKSKNKEKMVIPDSIFTLTRASEVLAVAVEVELSIKAKARYAEIFKGHWYNYKQRSLYDGVAYVFETKKAAKNFKEKILNPLIESTLVGDNFIEFLQSRVRLTSFEGLETASRTA